MCVETDPAGKVTHFLHKRWSELYLYDYVASCRELELQPVKYNLFCAMRKKYRPQYQRSRKLKKSGWTHVSCQKCEGYKDRLKCERDLVKKAELKAGYKTHLALSGGHRLHYK